MSILDLNHVCNSKMAVSINFLNEILNLYEKKLVLTKNVSKETAEVF